MIKKILVFLFLIFFLGTISVSAIDDNEILGINGSSPGIQDNAPFANSNSIVLFVLVLFVFIIITLICLFIILVSGRRRK